MSCYGYDRLTTPHIDRLAAEAHALRADVQRPHPDHQRLRLHAHGHGRLHHAGGRAAPQGPAAPGSQHAGRSARAKRATTRPASASAATRVRAASRPTSTIAGWGSWNEGRSPKAQNLNDVAIPELERLAKKRAPFFLFLRHMDPHAPYLPPEPYERMFYHGNECDPANKSMEPVMSFKPFCDFFASWMPPGITDKDYVIAQYDGAVAYMDAGIQSILTAVEDPRHLRPHHRRHQRRPRRDALRPRVLVRPSRPLRADAGRAADHPLSGRHARGQARGRLQPAQGPDAHPARTGRKSSATTSSSTAAACMPMVAGEVASYESEFYITECTWMRKHGWRTPQWKLIRALEPDFHFKPEVELYNLVEDPQELHNVAGAATRTSSPLSPTRMDSWIRTARGGDRPAQSDPPPGRLARPRGRRRLHIVAAGVRHAAHRRPDAGRQAAGRIADIDSMLPAHQSPDPMQAMPP